MDTAAVRRFQMATHMAWMETLHTGRTVTLRMDQRATLHTGSSGVLARMSSIEAVDQSSSMVLVHIAAVLGVADRQQSFARGDNSPLEQRNWLRNRWRR